MGFSPLPPSCQTRIGANDILFVTVTASKLSMMCPEQIRLQQLYEASVRRWAQIQASSQLLGQPADMTLGARKRALAARVDAKARLVMHQQNCKACRSSGNQE